jgi:hypothetical protein
MLRQELPFTVPKASFGNRKNHLREITDHLGCGKMKTPNGLDGGVEAQ